MLLRGTFKKKIVAKKHFAEWQPYYENLFDKLKHVIN